MQSQGNKQNFAVILECLKCTNPQNPYEGDQSKRREPKAGESWLNFTNHERKYNIKTETSLEVQSITLREGYTDAAKLFEQEKKESEKPVVSNKNAGPEGYVMLPKREDFIKNPVPKSV